MSLSFIKIFREVKSYSIITVGLFAYAFAWVNIITPAKIMGGGITGIGLIIYYITGGEAGGVPIGYSYLAINSVLIVIGVLSLGWVFGIKTIYSMAVTTVFLTVGQECLPENILGIADDKLLSAVLGGAICGFGVSRAIIQGGSTGGTDIIAMIITKYKSVSFGTVIMVCDVFIVGSSYFIYHDITTIIYGYISLVVLGFSADLAIQGRKRTCQLMINSKKYDEISDAIVSFGRGATVFSAQGWYTKNEQKMVMVYCRFSEAKQIQYLAKDIDPDAFIATTAVNGVLGQGFESLIRKPKEKAE